jgi:ppGpp synthetase/RelA/SpoT-type nucleotidyltranferase
MRELENIYRQNLVNALMPIARALEQQLNDYLKPEPRIDRIAARAKSLDRFLAKAHAAKDGMPKYSEPLRQIQDQIGARIVTFYRADVERVSTIVQRYYTPVESRDVVPDSEWEFGYFGRHYILLMPSDVIPNGIDKSLAPEFFELQIKTLFQHAWSEANHDLGYKPGATPLNADEIRRLAFTSAQAWGADRIFDELFRERAT